MDYNKAHIKQILMSRDGLSSDDADDLIEQVQQEIEDAIDRVCDLDELEEIIEDHLGLEPDFLETFIPL